MAATRARAAWPGRGPRRRCGAAPRRSRRPPAGTRARATRRDERELAADPLGGGPQLARARLREQHGELVAAEPAEHVGGPQVGGEGDRATRHSRSSPAAWPWVSLTDLKSSRSITIRPSGRPPWRTCSDRSASKRSVKPRRLRHPVSGSERESLASSRRWRSRFVACETPMTAAATSRAENTPTDVGLGVACQQRRRPRRRIRDITPQIATERAG